MTGKIFTRTSRSRSARDSAQPATLASPPLGRILAAVPNNVRSVVEQELVVLPDTPDAARLSKIHLRSMI